MRRKKKYIWAYLDGKKLVEVIQAALDNNMMVADYELTAPRPKREAAIHLSS